MARTGRPPIYPWADWFDGERHVLQPGVDFTLDATMMRRVVLAEARRRGYPVATRVKKGWIELKRREEPQSKPKVTDWDKVFAKSPAVLEEGTDFDGDMYVFAAAARNAASRRGLRCNITVAQGVVTIFSHRAAGIVPSSATEMAPTEEAG